jgi:hypothetical protein
VLPVRVERGRTPLCGEVFYSTDYSISFISAA